MHSLANEDADLMAKRQQMLDLQEALGGLGLDIGQYSNAELRDLLAGGLNRNGLFDTGADGCRTFTVGLAAKCFGRQGRDFNQQVDTIQEGAGEFAAIARNLVGCAAALSV